MTAVHPLYPAEARQALLSPRDVARALAWGKEQGLSDTSMKRFVLWLRAPERGLITDDEAQSLIDRYELNGA